MGDLGWVLDVFSKTLKVVPADGRAKKTMHMECAGRVAHYFKDSRLLRPLEIRRVG